MVDAYAKKADNRRGEGLARRSREKRSTHELVTGAGSWCRRHSAACGRIARRDDYAPGLDRCTSVRRTDCSQRKAGSQTKSGCCALRSAGRVEVVPAAAASASHAPRGVPLKDLWFRGPGHLRALVFRTLVSYISLIHAAASQEAGAVSTNQSKPTTMLARTNSTRVIDHVAMRCRLSAATRLARTSSGVSRLRCLGVR